jgi:integrase
VKFPKRIKHRGRVLATIYAKCKGRDSYHVAWQVDGYQRNVASVKRKDISEAVEEFIAIRKPLTEAKAGKRALLSKNYPYMVGLWLRDFAKTFPANAVCDLGKEHLNIFMRKSGTHAPKSRNHYRGAVKMFLTWCVKRDYLSPAHRLFEADGMATEAADTPELEYYRPEELKAMLDRAGENPEFKELLPVIALGGLAALRLEEILRLEWADIWRVAGHVEIKAQKAKTRSRRLVEICPALTAWLEPYREFSGAIFARSKDMFHETFGSLRDSLKIQARRNGLCRAFCTYHFAAHDNENLTAAQAGNSLAVNHGVLVSGNRTRESRESCHLREGDVIVTFGGELVSGIDQLHRHKSRSTAHGKTRSSGEPAGIGHQPSTELSKAYENYIQKNLSVGNKTTPSPACVPDAVAPTSHTGSISSIFQAISHIESTLPDDWTAGSAIVEFEDATRQVFCHQSHDEAKS